MVAPIIVECYVMTCLALHRLAIGYVLAFPAPLTAGLTEKNSSIHTTRDEASWIAASFSITAAMSFFILPPIMQGYGRRISNIIHNLILLVGAIVIGSAPNVFTIIIGQCIQGLGLAGFTLNVVIGAEYCHPRRRAFFLVIQSIGTCLGIILCHSLAFTLTWRQIAFVGAVIPTVTALSTALWPESPSWLAYKGREDDCVEAFEVLRGNDSVSRKEIRHLIIAQREIRKTTNIDNNIVVRTYHTFRCKEFLKPLVIMIVLETLAHVCGMYYLLAYVIQIMQELAGGDESKTFYYTLGFDFMKIVALIFASILMRLLKIRTLLFYSGSLACFLLGLVCIFNYLENIKVLGLRWLAPLLLILYNFTCHTGIIPVYIVVVSELFPLKYKSTGMCVIGVVYSILGFFTLKLTSILLDAWKVHGTFALYLVVAIACLIFLYFFLPETKNRTLQDIEMDFIDIKIEPEIDDEEMIGKLVKEK